LEDLDRLKELMDKNKELQDEIDRLRRALENYKDANQIYVPDAKDPLDN
jgi:cell division septum initiation protein DivIVA